MNNRKQVSIFDRQPELPWSLWYHEWIPHSKGIYQLRLKAQVPTSSSQRLDSGYYVRMVEITEL